MTARKAGRPTLGEAKLVQRAVTSDPEIEEFLRKNPSVNASDVFRRAVHSKTAFPWENRSLSSSLPFQDVLCGKTVPFWTSPRT